MLMERYARADFDDFDDFSKNYRVQVPENFNFAFDCVDELAREKPDATAMVWCNEAGESATFTFGQMAAYSDAAARFFASLGIGKGDAVMLILKRRIQYWFALLGLMKLGAVSIPATHMLTEKDIVYRNNAADIKAIITVDDAALVQAIDDAMPDSPTIRHHLMLGKAADGWLSFDVGLAAHMQGEAPRRTSQNADTMMMYFTSGTTGLPKMVSHDFTYPLGHITTARYWHALHPGSLHFTIADTGWAKAAWGKIFGQWLCEAAIFVYDHDHFNAGDLLKVIERHKVTSFCAPPTVFRLFVKMNLAAYDLSHLEHFTTAGEALSAEVYNRFKEMTGHCVREGYGQTEVGPIAFTPPFIPPKPGSIGCATPAYPVMLLDEDGNEVANGEGEICVKAVPGEYPGIFRGYYRDDTITAKAWHDGIYHTGDRASIDEDGYIWFIGRADDVIKTAGYRVGPYEVESVLAEHPAVQECAVTGVKDPLRGEVIKATVVLAEGYEPSGALQKELQAFMLENTAAYKCPRLFEFVKTMQKTISGKIKRAAIRQGAEAK